VPNSNSHREDRAARGLLCLSHALVLERSIPDVSEASEMTAQAPTSARFVVVAAVAGVDEKDSSAFVVESAARIAGSVAGSELHLIHVLHGYEPLIGSVIPNPWTGMEILQRGRDYLDRITKIAAVSFHGRVVGHLANGEPWREIVQCAEYMMADLVVVGSNGLTGIRRLALGSVSELVARRAKCAVLVARPKSYEASDVPEIEPACPDCLTTQAKTRGESLWCTRHATHHPIAHLHYEFPQPFAVGSELIRP